MSKKEMRLWYKKIFKNSLKRKRIDPDLLLSDRQTRALSLPHTT